MCLSKQVERHLFRYKAPQARLITKVTGFSLIELMVVMAIMAVLMSLSGGLMHKSINQQARQVELEQVRQLFKKLSYKAYYGGGEIQVRLERNQMQIAYEIDAPLLGEFREEEVLAEEGNKTSVDNQKYDVEIIDFEQLTFVAQDYSVSSKGIIIPTQYQVFWLEDIKSFELNSLFSEPNL